VFVSTPDGKAYSYALEGTALPPRDAIRLEATLACKKQHIQKVPVKNWLHEKQRFEVKVELVEPAPDSTDAQGLSLQKGVGTLDLPAGMEREYKFSVYAYHEGRASIRVSLISVKTGEYIVVDVVLTFVAPEPLATIKVDAACRQIHRHKIAVTNPLDRPASFTGSSSLDTIAFSPEVLIVPPKSEKQVELLFRPIEEGSGETDRILSQARLKLVHNICHFDLCHN
jgi:hypothetical protein